MLRVTAEAFTKHFVGNIKITLLIANTKVLYVICRITYTKSRQTRDGCSKSSSRLFYCGLILIITLIYYLKKVIGLDMVQQTKFIDIHM